LVPVLISGRVTKCGHQRIVARRGTRRDTPVGDGMRRPGADETVDWDAARPGEQVAWYPHRPGRRSGVPVCRAAAHLGIDSAADELY
jgi:hypothetical protein